MTPEDPVAPSAWHPRPRVWIALGIALVSIALMVWVWRAGATPGGGTELPAVESHGLDTGQASCLRFGLIVRRSSAVDLTLGLGKYQSLDPGLRADLAREFVGLDAIAADYPDIDAGLVAAFDRIAREDEAVLVEADSTAYRGIVTTRSARLAEASRACLELVNFDVEALAVGQSGQS